MLYKEIKMNLNITVEITLFLKTFFLPNPIKNIWILTLHAHFAYDICGFYANMYRIWLIIEFGFIGLWRSYRKLLYRSLRLITGSWFFTLLPNTQTHFLIGEFAIIGILMKLWGWKRCTRGCVQSQIIFCTIDDIQMSSFNYIILSNLPVQIQFPNPRRFLRLTYIRQQEIPQKSRSRSSRTHRRQTFKWQMDKIWIRGFYIPCIYRISKTMCNLPI